MTLEQLINFYRSEAKRIGSNSSCGDGLWDRQERNREVNLATNTAEYLQQLKELLAAAVES